MTNPTPDGCEGAQRELLGGWGNTPRSAADVFTPRDATGVRAVAGRHNHDSLLARGLGRSYGDAALNGGGAVVDMTSVTGVRGLDIAGRTVTVAGGMSFDALLAALVPLGLFVPVTPGTRFVTIGGAIAADVHGKNHHVDGSIQRHLEGFELLLASGDTLHVTRDSEPEVFAATAGGLGLTGIITKATLRLLPIETAHMRVTRERTANLDATLARFRESDAQYQYSVAWVDCLARGEGLGRAVLMRANHATLGDLPDRQRERPLAMAEGPHVRWPRWTPPGLLRRSTVGLANEVIFRRAPGTPRESIEGILPYFYPLDRVRQWNRAYGPRGFVQYQFVVPDGAEETLRHTIETLSSRDCPSLLAVLKRMGDGHGMLSFPMRGWTLALDIPAGVPGLGGLLDELDLAVADAGGRVYLAKDARMRPELLPGMYPELERWKAVQRRLDPEGRLRSDLARRLDLV